MKAVYGLGIFFPPSLGSINHNKMLYADYYLTKVPFSDDSEWVPFLIDYYGSNP